jgi:hypothetical protein
LVLVLWRQVQKIKSDKWDELEKVNKKFNEIEKRLGFPMETKKRYRLLLGRDGVNTLIVEFQWESMAKMEKVYTKAILDPEYQKLSDEAMPLIEENRWELLVPWPAFPE